MLVERLCEELHTLAHCAPGFCYLLMQPAEMESDEDQRFRALATSAGIEVIPLRIPLLPETLRPYLMPLALSDGLPATLSAMAVEMAVNDRQYNALIRGCTQRNCAWIWTSKTAEELRHHLERQAIVPCAASHSNRRWLRYYDPMVVDVLWEALSDEYRSQLFSEIAQWAYIDRWSELSVLRPPDAHAHSNAQIEWRRVAGIGSINQAWIRAIGQDRRIGREHFMEHRHLVQTASDAGMQGPDLDLFAHHALELGREFQLHHVGKEMLAAVKVGESYRDVASRIDAATWQRVREEISRMSGDKNNVGQAV